MPSIYSDVLIDHFRNPRNYGSLASPDISHEDFNPLCGDRIRIELQLQDSIIKAARFVGDGCAISLGSASMLTELVEGADIRRPELISSEQLLLALNSDIKPARRRCALLPLEVLNTAVRNYRDRPSE